MVLTAEAMLVEADGSCIFAVRVLAVGYGARGRLIAIHKAIANRRAVHGAIVHITARLVKIAVARPVMFTAGTVPLSLWAVIRRVP